MRTGQRLGGTLVLLGAAVMLGCGGNGPSLSPSSLTPFAGPGSARSTRPLDDEYPMPQPTPAPMPDPAPAPVPDPAPPPGALTIRIIGSFGGGAFTPNPVQAAIGDRVVWTNADATRHSIVLDDGTPVGDIAPGQSTAPMALTTSMTTYHCTIHPSMIGTISDPSVATPVPPPPPVYEPPPYDPYPY